MDKRLRIAGIVGAVIFSIFVLTSPNDPIPLPDLTSENFENKSLEILAENLENPRSMAFADDRIFVTQKNGQIRVVYQNELLDEPLATLRPANVFDGGLLGITTHPEFNENHFLYVFLTYEEDNVLWNKILKITESENKLKDAETIFDKIPGSVFTNGGFLKFGPDGKLYVGTGTVSDASHLPQDLDSFAGKILRLNDDGTIPNDNPYSNSPVFSIGFRNPQGMAWDKAGSLYVADLGPDKNDEINIIKAGKNYGWPDQECLGNEKFEGAIMCYDPGIEPGGILFYYGNTVQLEHAFVMTSLRASNLYQLDLNDGLKSQKSILSGVGRIRDVIEGPEGSLYVITSNTDGKGFPDKMDDRLLRILK
jgi:glucose/arabinose dehydrogenase